MREDDQVIANLARCDILSGTGQGELESPARQPTPFAVPAGTVLLRRGSIADEFLLVTRVAFGAEGAERTIVVADSPILGEIALLRGGRCSATVTAETDMRGLTGGRAAFARLLAIPGVLQNVMAKARQRLAAGITPVPVALRDAVTVGLRPIFPGDRQLLAAEREHETLSDKTLYQRFFAGGPATPAMIRYLTEVDYVDHFAWVAVTSGGVSVGDVSVGGVSYVRSACDLALADISFLITDKFQGRGLGTLLMGAAAIAAQRNAITRFSADVLAENVPMRAILNHAAIGWEPTTTAVVHGVFEAPDPGRFGVTPGTAAALGAIVDTLVIRS